ncbi:MAG TPA: DUF4251 domain-containing protein [Flavitalea sp.]|nr:DUF4251 domain-containing protein [Flavitalea sp.]
MKSMISFLIMSLFSLTATMAQSDKTSSIKDAIESKQYIFKARTVLPSNGSTRQLTSEYDFTVNKDSILAYLPYFGRAYVATIGNTDGGINFTCTEFSYKVTEEKKGGWIIRIKPKNAGDVQLINLNISKKGYGTLHVDCQNRQGISYTGKVDPLKKNQ